jgi:hypothetical protein
MKLPLSLFAIAAIAALPACNKAENQSVANRFDQATNAIANTAETIEAETENAVRATESALDNQASSFGNRVDRLDGDADRNKAAPARNAQ